MAVFMKFIENKHLMKMLSKIKETIAIHITITNTFN